VTTLLHEADRLGRLEDTLTALRAATIACRGPKPVAALKRYNVPAQIRAIEPYTSTELLGTLSAVVLGAKAVALVHYGEPNHALADALRSRGAHLDEWYLYEWLMPEDREPLAGLVRDLIEERVDAIAFTSQIQFRHLFQAAADMGKAADLVGALNHHTIVAAIGPVCAAALRAQGITPDVLPAHPKMGALLTALADYIELSNPSTDDL
jgi:uroporphyrinogen-III synthase